MLARYNVSFLPSQVVRKRTFIKKDTFLLFDTHNVQRGHRLVEKGCEYNTQYYGTAAYQLQGGGSVFKVDGEGDIPPLKSILSI